MGTISSNLSLIEIENLSLSIFDSNTKETKELLDDFSLKIAPNMRVGITGPSGCGKTTLLRSIIKNKPPEVSKYGKFKRRDDLKIGYMPQSEGLLPWYSLRKNLCHFCSHEEVRAGFDGRATQVINALDLNDCIDNFPCELSGGERQRGLLACAILIRPTIFLADESLTEVDLEKKLRMLSFWSEEIERENASLLLISHDVETLIYMCDKIMVLRGTPAHVENIFTLSGHHPRVWDQLFSNEPEEVREKLHTLLISDRKTSL